MLGGVYDCSDRSLEETSELKMNVLNFSAGVDGVHFITCGLVSHAFLDAYKHLYSLYLKRFIWIVVRKNTDISSVSMYFCDIRVTHSYVGT